MTKDGHVVLLDYGYDDDSYMSLPSFARTVAKRENKMIRMTVGQLRNVIRRALREQAWVPGRYNPGAEPLSKRDAARLNQPLGMDPGERFDEDDDEWLEEVNTDPSDNPGRPADAESYIGMKPPMGGGGGGSTTSGGGDILSSLGQADDDEDDA